MSGWQIAWLVRYKDVYPRDYIMMQLFCVMAGTSKTRIICLLILYLPLFSTVFLRPNKKANKPNMYVFGFDDSIVRENIEILMIPRNHSSKPTCIHHTQFGLSILLCLQ